MSLVLDSSATLAWCFEDESTPTIDAMFERIADQGAVVPALWRLEVANGLHMGVRRRRLDADRRDQLLATLDALDIRRPTGTPGQQRCVSPTVSS